MISRLITAGLGIPLVILVLIAPWPWLFCTVFCAISLLLAWEIPRFAKHLDPHVIAISFISIIAIYLSKYFAYFGGHPGLGETQALVGILFFNFFAAAALYLIIPRFEHALTSLAVSLLAVFYGGVILSYGIELRFFEVIRHNREGFESFLRGLFSAKPHDQVGILYVFYVLIVAWMWDTGAYVIGSAFGRNNRMGLAASPNKSWAGLVGGLLVAVASFLVFHVVCRQFFDEAYQLTFFGKSLGGAIALTAVLGLFTQVGDLIESVLKRAAGVKDSGTWLRGHGGLFDAIDSVVPTLFLFHFFLVRIAPRITG